MKLISHRGNLYGPNQATENSPQVVIQALHQGFEVEIDVWYVDDEWFLGHDSPQYPIGLPFLQQKGLWCHAKNLCALTGMLYHPFIHCFWHQTDYVTLTNRGIPWCFPGFSMEKGISVLHSRNATIPRERILGICTDWISDYV